MKDKKKKSKKEKRAEADHPDTLDLELERQLAADVVVVEDFNTGFSTGNHSVIEGIRIDLTGAKLKEHLLSRAEFHGRKVQLYREKDSLARESAEGEYRASADTKSYSNEIDWHSDRVLYFQLLAGNLIDGEVYRISWEEVLDTFS